MKNRMVYSLGGRKKYKYKKEEEEEEEEEKSTLNGRLNR